MSDSAASVGRSPVNVALLRFVGDVRTKSSADSISILPAELGREAVAILPSGLPVLKKYDSAAEGVAVRMAAPIVAMLMINPTVSIDGIASFTWRMCNTPVQFCRIRDD